MSIEKEALYDHFGHDGNIYKHVYQAPPASMELFHIAPLLTPIGGKKTGKPVGVIRAISGQNADDLGRKSPVMTDVHFESCQNDDRCPF